MGERKAEESLENEGSEGETGKEKIVKEGKNTVNEKGEGRGLGVEGDEKE